ncbi:serine/Arginine-related protein 53-like isoform X2 [Ptychodera flava]|uniref:serine/Arginine-related protein 53-like isoform X2 n=1 Tax=Ptychodera flava TaxID=63121 RepID=UPI00396A6412
MGKHSKTNSEDDDREKKRHKHTKHRSRSRSRERNRDDSHRSKKRRSKSQSPERDRSSRDSNKARKRRSRSRSTGRDRDDSSKSKTKKSVRRSRSPSPFRDTYSQRRNWRSRSRSPFRVGSKSHVVRRRSRSRSRGRQRSRSRSRGRQRSRSRSRGRQRSRSRSRGRQRSRSRSRGRQRSRSRSRGRQRSRSRSRGRRSRSPLGSRSKRSKRSRSRSRSRSKQIVKDEFGRDKRRSRERSYSRSPSIPRVMLEMAVEDKKLDPFADIPGFNDMTPAEKTKIRMQKALEAAASADAALRQKGLLQSGDKLSLAEQMQRQQAIEDIEQDGFVPSAFKSSQDSKPTPSASLTGADESHDAAIFGGGSVSFQPFTGAKSQKKNVYVYKDRGPLASHSLFVSAEEKEERWIKKLEAMRNEKLWKYKASLIKQENEF